MLQQGLISLPGNMSNCARLTIGLFVFTSMILPGFLLGATRNFPHGNLSLQDVVSRASGGDVIIVAPGTYQFSFDNLVIVDESLVLKSSDGAAQTILVGTGRGPVVSFAAGSKVVLDGFTITSITGSRQSDLQGGGIYCSPESAPIIINNIIKDNSAVFGGGIYCDTLSAPMIKGNYLSGNTADVAGGGIFSNRSAAVISNNVFIENEAKNSGGAIAGNRDNGRVENNVIWKNKAGFGGGLSYDRAATIVANNTIVGNIAGYGGGIVVDKGSVRLTNLIFWRNKVDDVYLKQIGPSARPARSLIGDGMYRGMNGNLNQDPLFVDEQAGDFHLKPESPCIDAGDIDPYYYEDVDGSVNDMGAYGGPGVLTGNNLIISNKE